MNREHKRKMKKKTKRSPEGVSLQVKHLEENLHRAYVEVLTLRRSLIDLSEALFDKGVLTQEELKQASEKVSKASAEVNAFIKKVNDTIESSEEGVESDITLREVATKSLQYGIHPSRYKFTGNSQQTYLMVVIDTISKLPIENDQKFALAQSQGLLGVYKEILEKQAAEDAKESVEEKEQSVDVTDTKGVSDVEPDAEKGE